MPKIYCSPDEQNINAGETETILQAVLAFGIPHTHVCGGLARCSTCRILITDGLEYCSLPTAYEQVLAIKLGFPKNIRLACQTKISGDVSLRRMVLDNEDIELVENQMMLGSIGEEKNMAVLFADLRGFTKFSEAMLPYDVIYILNRYFNHMNIVINRNDGIINNYMGDGFMALFGIDVESSPSSAVENAVRAGVEMLEELELLNKHLEMLYHRPLRMGIGIHFGWAILGAVGASENKSVTAIGDTVNFASRIESANKEFGTNFLISEDVYKLVKDLAIVNSECMEVSIRGKSGNYRLYEVKGMKESVVRKNSKPRPKSKSQASTLNVFSSLGKLLKVIFNSIELITRNIIRKVFKRSS